MPNTQRSTPDWEDLAVPELNDMSSIALVLGEIRGQLRELVHSSNNNGAKLDALAIRVTALEAESNQRRGARDVVGMALRSPVLGWIVGAAVSAWAILTGKVHI